MQSIQRPSERAIRDFLTEQQEKEFSYAEIGFSYDGIVDGYNNDHYRVRLGKGANVFNAAQDALCKWQMFPGDWASVTPFNTPIQVGNVVAMLARAFGLWWLNACRIVYVFDEEKPIRRFGFAYGTLPDHVESGEERFSVEWDPNDCVWYDLHAFSRPRHWLAQLGHPITRHLQRKFVRQSQLAMRQAIAHALGAQPVEAHI